MGDSAPPLRDPWALSESARRRLVTVARQQHLPKGWLAERRSGGHYIIFNPAGDRFTSLTAAKQQAKRDEDARARAGEPPLEYYASDDDDAAPPPPPSRRPAADQPPKKTSRGAGAARVEACVADEAPYLDAKDLFEPSWAHVEGDEGWPATLDAALGGKRQCLGAWRRGDRLEACYKAVFAAGYRPAAAAAVLRRSARRRSGDARQRPWRRSDEVEAARLIVSQKKDLSAVAAGLDRSLGDVVCWYYREYKAQRAAVKARWPSAVAYAAMKAKRAAEDGDDDDLRAEVDRPWGGLEEDGVADADDRAAPIRAELKSSTRLQCARN